MAQDTTFGNTFLEIINLECLYPPGGPKLGSNIAFALVLDPE